MEHFFTSKYNQILGSVALAMAGLAFLSYAILNFETVRSSYPMPANISVNGVGEATVVPDVGQFTFSVMAEGATAAEVQGQSATKVNEILAYLKAEGVEEKDIKTQEFNLSPRYRFEERACAFGMYCPPGEQVQDGFTVSQSVEVKVRDTAKAGDLISGVGERGATNMSNLNFIIDDIEAIKAEARSLAVADAKAKAEKLAEDLGVELVRITGFYENEGFYNAPYAEKAMSMDLGMGGEGFVSPEIPVGENTTTVQVSVTYEVK
jgi:uncharacterized protein YggE